MCVSVWKCVQVPTEAKKECQIPWSWRWSDCEPSNVAAGSRPQVPTLIWWAFSPVPILLLFLFVLVLVFKCRVSHMLSTYCAPGLHPALLLLQIFPQSLPCGSHATYEIALAGEDIKGAEIQCVYQDCAGCRAIYGYYVTLLFLDCELGCSM